MAKTYLEQRFEATNGPSKSAQTPLETKEREKTYYKKKIQILMSDTINLNYAIDSSYKIT